MTEAQWLACTDEEVLRRHLSPILSERIARVVGRLHLVG